MQLFAPVRFNIEINFSFPNASIFFIEPLNSRSWKNNWILYDPYVSTPSKKPSLLYRASLEDKNLFIYNYQRSFRFLISIKVYTCQSFLNYIPCANSLKILYEKKKKKIHLPDILFLFVLKMIKFFQNATLI